MKVAIIPVTRFQQNCSLLVCEETNNAAVVDPGGDLALILDAVQQQGVVLEKIRRTHGHIDHCGGTANLSKEHGLPVEGSLR
jgi:hydroxyacylglutathione hydrolase